MKLKKAFWWVVLELPTLIAGIAGFASLLLVTVNVIGRYAFRHSIPGIDELVVICFSYLVFVGAASAYRAKMHYGIDVFVNMLPPQGQRAMEIFTRILIAVLSCAVIYLDIHFANAAWTRTTTYWHIPYFYVDIPIAIGFVYILIYALMDLYKLIFKPEQAQKEREEKQLNTIS